jgi:hypothetical protein
MTTPKLLSEGYSDGTLLGNSTTDKIGFHGKTCTTRRSAPASIGASATTAILKAAINVIRNALITKGLLA